VLGQTKDNFYVVNRVIGPNDKIEIFVGSATSSGVNTTPIEVKEQATIAQVNFGFGNSALRESEIKKLDALAGVIKSRGFKTITIYGHTDSIGPDSVSDWLSKSRAIAVQKYLSFKLKGTSVKFRVAGFSEKLPIASNANPSGRLLNRRVEIAVGP
jgi:OOP family OmpA-OmpF porin